MNVLTMEKGGWWKGSIRPTNEGKKEIDIFGIMAIMGIIHIWEFSHETGQVLFLRKP